VELVQQGKVLLAVLALVTQIIQTLNLELVVVVQGLLEQTQQHKILAMLEVLV
jgi:hypothetical protein